MLKNLQLSLVRDFAANLSSTDNPAVLRQVAQSFPFVKELRKAIRSGQVTPVGLRRLFEAIYEFVEFDGSTVSPRAFIPLIVSLEASSSDIAEEILLIFARVDKPGYRSVREVARLSLHSRQQSTLVAKPTHKSFQYTSSIQSRHKPIKMRVSREDCNA